MMLTPNVGNVKTGVNSHCTPNDIMESNQDEDNEGLKNTTMGAATFKAAKVNDIGLVNGNSTMNLLEATRNEALMGPKEMPISPTVKDI